MAEGIADCMPLALRSVGDAIKLDSENRTKEAYCQYLSCIMYISQVLKDDAWDKDLRQVYNSDTAKLFRLLQQCQERALTIISTLESVASTTFKPEAEKSTQNLQVPSAGIQRRYSDSAVVDPSHSGQSKAPQSRAPHEPSEATAPGTRLTAPASDGYLHLPSPPGSPMPRHQRTGSYDPLEKAYQENKHLIAAYRTRMQNANKGRRNQDVISKNLGLMRRMSENLVIAKAREEAIKKKLLERQQRLQEETNRRFGPVVSSTREEQEQRTLYLKILEFEQETFWPKHLREKLKLMPSDTKLIKEIITKIFCSSDHPLTQFLFQYQYHVYRKLAPLIKDVGFKNVKSGHKATSKGTDITFSGAQSDQKHAITPDTEHVGTTDRDHQDDNKSPLSGEIESGGTPSPEVNSSESLRGIVKKDGCEEDKNDAVGIVGEEYNGDLNDGMLEDQEGKRSTTDLERLKSLLDEGAQSDGATENKQADTSAREQGSSLFEESDNSEKLETYFEELEDDMFDWESSEGEDERESNVVGNTHEITSEENVCENKKASDKQIQEIRTDDREEAISTNDEKPSSELDSLGQDENENSPNKVSEDETYGPDKTEALKEHEIEHGNVDADYSDQRTGDDSALDANQVISSKSNKDNTRRSDQTVPLKENKIDCENNDEESDQPTGSAKPSVGNKSIDSQEEQHTEEGQVDCTNVSDKEETTPTEPHADLTTVNNEEAPQALNTTQTRNEEMGGSMEVDNQVETQMPKLSLFEERNGENINGSVPRETFPQADEVRKQLKDILVDVRFFLEKLQTLLVLAYEPLDTPAGRDLCYSCVELPFFKPLWPMLLAVLRQVNFDKEVCLADVMSAHISKGPFDMGVPQRLCMEDQEVLDSTGNKYPYQMAVEELHKLVTMFCPLEKLECLVRTSRCICQCVEDYWENKGKPRHSPETAIGCDELLPILSFVIIRSGMAQLISECDAMEEFIPEGYLMGEEGYCLTTLVTALAYLATLKPM